MKKIIVLITLFSLAIAPLPAKALIVFDPTNYTQNVYAYVRQALQYAQQLQQTAQQLQMLANQATNLANMPQAVAQQVMNSIKNNLNQLQNIQNGSRSMTASYGQFSVQFDQMYPGYASYNGMSATQYSNQVLQMQQQTDKAVHDSMAAQGLVDPTKMQGETNTLNGLISASQTTTGALQAAQTGSQIAAFQSQQLMEQKQIMAAGFSAQSSYIAKQSQQEQAADAAANAMMQGWGDWNKNRTPSNIQQLK